MTSVNWPIGGTSLFGGYGSTRGGVIGAFIPATLQNGFVIGGIQPFWQQAGPGPCSSHGPPGPSSGSSMKAVVYDAPGSFSIKEIPAPDPAPGEVRVRARQTGICGTDLHIHNGKFFAEFPLTPGHELIGPVDALGEGTTGLITHRFALDQYASALDALRNDRTVHKIIIEC